MSGMTLVVFVAVAGIVWGGFGLLLFLALRAERRKGREP